MPDWSAGKTRPVPLLFVIDHLQNPYAGTEGQLYKLIANLDRKAFAPELLVFSDSQYLREFGFPCPYRVLGHSRLSSLATWWRLFVEARRFRARGGRLAHVFFNDASIICPPLFSMSGIRTLISRRDMGYWYSPLIQRVLRVTGRFVGGVVVNSRAVGEVTQMHERIGEDRIHVIYNGVDQDGCHPGDTSEKTVTQALREQGYTVALLVANIRPIKRIDDAIEALAQLRESCPNLVLVLVGAGDEMPLKQRAEQLGVAERVRFLGARQDVDDLLGGADIGLLCSESEGFSNAIVEYMLKGLPVICSDTGGNPEAVTEGRTGFLYPVGDTGQLADSMERLVHAPELRHTLGRQAREDAATRFSVATMIERHRELYEHVLDRC